MKPIICSVLALTLAGCVQSAANLRENEAAGHAAFNADKSLADSFAIVQSNATHCWADAANYIIAAAPPSPARPPSIQINSVLGHLMAVVDFAESGAGTEVTVRVGYSLGNKARTAEWQHALEAWLTGSNMDYCPRMP
jgi:hypothetical protein